MDQVFHRCVDGELVRGKEHDCKTCKVKRKYIGKIRPGGKVGNTTGTQGRRRKKGKMQEIWLQ